MRLKTGYAFFEKIPNLTFDADLQYMSYKTIHIAGIDNDKKFTQLFASLGLTYQFGFDKSRPEATTEQPALPTSAPTSSPTEALANSKEVETISGENLGFNLQSSTFKIGSAVLSQEAQVQFASAAKFIVQKNINVRIEGHTDSTGDLKTNEALSKARAEAVKVYLVEKGVSADRITTNGFGSSKPIADNNTTEGRAKNRRVEIFFDK